MNLYNFISQIIKTLTMKCTNRGENVRRWRSILSLTQEELAEKLNIAQPKVSNLEQQEVIDDEILEEISKAIGIPVKLLKECDHEDNMTKIINFFNSDSGTQTLIENQHQINNPIEKISELYERIVELTAKNIRLEAEMEQLKRK